MGPTTLIQLALGFMRLANWIARQVDQYQWKQSGYASAMVEQADETKRILGLADKAVVAAKKASPSDQSKSLESDL